MADEHYKILGLSPDADLMQVRRAFYTMSLLHDPNINGDEGDPQLFRKIEEAYLCLTNKLYNESCDHVNPSSPQTSSSTRQPLVCRPERGHYRYNALSQQGRKSNDRHDNSNSHLHADADCPSQSNVLQLFRPPMISSDGSTVVYSSTSTISYEINPNNEPVVSAWIQTPAVAGASRNLKSSFRPPGADFEIDASQKLNVRSKKR